MTADATPKIKLVAPHVEDFDEMVELLQLAGAQRCGRGREFEIAGKLLAMKQVAALLRLKDMTSVWTENVDRGDFEQLDDAYDWWEKSFAHSSATPDSVPEGYFESFDQ